MNGLLREFEGFALNWAQPQTPVKSNYLIHGKAIDQLDATASILAEGVG
jgi:hypothetical protein